MVDEGLIEKIPALEVAGGRTYNVLSLDDIDSIILEEIPEKLLYSIVKCEYIYADMAFVRYTNPNGSTIGFRIPQKDLGIIHYLNRPLN